MAARVTCAILKTFCNENTICRDNSVNVKLMRICFTIQTLSCQYRNSHDKAKPVSQPYRLSIVMGIPLHRKTVFILKRTTECQRWPRRQVWTQMVTVHHAKLCKKSRRVQHSGLMGRAVWTMMDIIVSNKHPVGCKLSCCCDEAGLIVAHNRGHQWYCPVACERVSRWVAEFTDVTVKTENGHDANFTETVILWTTALEAVEMTTSSAASNGNFVKMTFFSVCHHWWNNRLSLSQRSVLRVTTKLLF